MGTVNYFVTDWMPHPLKDRWDTRALFGHFTMGSRLGLKYFAELEEDIQRVLRESWTEYPNRQVTLIYLHECGNVTRADISV
jgi:hypothetical protein